MKYLFFSFFFLMLFSCAYKQEKADLVVHNATIYTLDKKNTIAQAMAIKDGKIIAIGAEREILNKYSAVEYYDAGLKPVYPGFIDAHGHLLNLGQTFLNADLVGTGSFEEVISKVQGHYKKFPTKVIRGRGWDQNDWEIKEFPSKKKLDELFPDIPVILQRVDGHAALVNQKVFDLAGVNENSVIEGGEYIKKDGKLTGVLIDNAIDYVEKVLPKYTDEEIEKALLLAQERCLQYGLTTVDDAGMDEPTFAMLKKMEQSGKLKMRVYVMIAATRETLEKYTAEGIYKTDRIHFRSFKFVSDGALGSRGACLKQPYSDVHEHPHYGAMLYNYSFMEYAADLLNETGFQMNTHCIGDSANKAVLDIYAKYLKDMNLKRWRIEHAQVMDEKDFDYFKKYSILPSVQPTHATSDMYWAGDRLGKEREKNAYAYKKLLQQNEMIALGTDFPVEDVNPFKTFYAAIARKDAKGFPKGGYNMDNALTREETIKGMTIWAAYYNFEENEKGTIEVGKLADFVVLNHDIMKVPEEVILKTFVEATFIGGEKVYLFR
ncbi:MAG: amidohydrolase [Bacteroidota bacterium]